MHVGIFRLHVAPLFYGSCCRTLSTVDRWHLADDVAGWRAGASMCRRWRDVASCCGTTSVDRVQHVCLRRRRGHGWPAGQCVRRALTARRRRRRRRRRRCRRGSVLSRPPSDATTTRPSVGRSSSSSRSTTTSPPTSLTAGRSLNRCPRRLVTYTRHTSVYDRPLV